jgi:hypothetical protein
MASRQGIFLKAVIENQACFADYFPHAIFGDISIENFLSTFKEQKFTCQKKCWHFLQQELIFKNIRPQAFLNHGVISDSPLAKYGTYKIKLTDDILANVNLLNSLPPNLKLRLDANGLFTESSYQHFHQSLHPNVISQIEYLEDPSINPDWSWINIPAAEDFILGKPAEYKIFKPNREFWDPADKRKKIFSSYQGSELGSWHTYQELLKFGNLDFTHGINNHQLYEEDLGIFSPCSAASQQYEVNLNKVKEMYSDLSQLSWSELCLI